MMKQDKEEIKKLKPFIVGIVAAMIYVFKSHHGERESVKTASALFDAWEETL